MIMKQSYSLILISTLMAGLFCSCHINKISGDGNVVSKEIQIEDYDEIQIEGENIDLKYTQSDDAPYLKIETDQNIHDLLKIIGHPPQKQVYRDQTHLLYCDNQLDHTERVQNGRKRQLRLRKRPQWRETGN